MSTILVLEDALLLLYAEEFLLEAVREELFNVERVDDVRLAFAYDVLPAEFAELVLYDPVLLPDLFVVKAE